MAFPPTVPSGARINTTPQVDLHPADHVEIHAALTDIVTVLGADPAGDAADVTARFALEMPVGVVLPYAGASAPSGWALCDGTAVNRTTYATLFGRIGTTFGTGDGSTTFNLPDMRSRFPAGKGPASWASTLGATGGSSDAVVVTHTHADTLAAPAHTHTINHDHGSQLFMEGKANGFTNETQASDVGGNRAGDANDTVAAHTGSSGPASATALTGSITATGVSGTNQNLPPYLTLNYIIRLS